MQHFTICSPHCQAKSVDAPGFEHKMGGVKRKSGPLALAVKDVSKTSPSLRRRPELAGTPYLTVRLMVVERCSEPDCPITPIV